MRNRRWFKMLSNNSASNLTPLPPGVGEGFGEGFGAGFGAGAQVQTTRVVTSDVSGWGMAVLTGVPQLVVHVPVSHVASPADVSKVK